MRAARFYGDGKGLVLEDVDRPVPGAGQVLIDVRAAGVCGTELHFLDGLLTPACTPITLGHEVAGVVAEVGSGVTSAAVGDRVAVHHFHACGRCRRCLAGDDHLCDEPLGALAFATDGGFADYVVVPVSAVVPVPDGLDLVAAAPLCCSGTTALHAAGVSGVGEGATAASDDDRRLRLRWGRRRSGLKTFLCCGVHGTRALTAVTVQNSLGVSGFYELPPHAVAEQVEAVVTDIGVQATKTGMLASAAVIGAVAEVVARLDVGPFVVDPVCASQHGDPLLRPDALEALRELVIPLATLVTPNLPEARLLTGLDVRGRGGMSEAARALHAMGATWVLVKGGHAENNDGRAIDVLFDGQRESELVAVWQDTPHTHGTGDTLAAAATAALARGIAVDAVRAGKDFVTAAVADSFPLGAGLGPVGHFWRVAAEAPQ